jgi:hypothetical protein
MNTIHRINILGILTILIFCVAGNIMGQNASKADEVPIKKADHIDGLIQRNIEHAIKEKETEWTLANRYPMTDGSSIVLIWTSGKQKVNASVFFLASQDDAARSLRSLRDTIPIGPGNAVDNLGDEAYSWGTGAIRFRKANIVIVIYASALDLSADTKSADLIKLERSWLKIAKRFAEHVAEQIGSFNETQQ